jgi:hypothetical protein
MNIAQYVIRQLEDSITKCEHIDASEEGHNYTIKAMESAVAFYTGSMVGPKGNGKGYLLYTLADEMCKEFKTCGKKGNELHGTSKVNLDIFHEFEVLRENLANRTGCTPAKKNKDRIASLMTVPIIQATLRSAYVDSHYHTDLTNQALGAAFSLSVIPYAAACHPPDGEVLYENMKAGRTVDADFGQVKAAFENNFRCLHITCKDVGGYYNRPLVGRPHYFEGAEPCEYTYHLSTMEITIIALVSTIIFCIGFCWIFFWCIGPRRPRRKKEHSDDEEIGEFINRPTGEVA